MGNPKLKYRQLKKQQQFEYAVRNAYFSFLNIFSKLQIGAFCQNFVVDIYSCFFFVCFVRVLQNIHHNQVKLKVTPFSCFCCCLTGHTPHPKFCLHPRRQRKVQKQLIGSKNSTFTSPTPPKICTCTIYFIFLQFFFILY